LTSRNYWPVGIRPEVLAFGTRADDYEKGRPDYPPAAIRVLTEALGITAGSTVVDLAAGTGKLTRALLPSGARVVAVEPVAGMRDSLVSTVPGVEVLEGTAEQIPLPDGFARALTVGQAFHWFRGPEALSEIHRVLGLGGGLGLIWNARDLDQPVQAELSQLMEKFRGDTPSQETGAWRAAFEQTRLFTPLTEERFSMEQVLDVEQLIARVLSVSFMAALPADEQGAVAGRLNEIARRHGGPTVLQYTTRVYCCQAIAGL
jgi:ubiquinone/menaquinone biosynthesis C-methylase UbiE